MSKHPETKEKLLDTAIELVWKSSYSTVGVAEICEKAGVTKGSFYHYFSSKAELFHAASEHAWDKMKGDLDAIFSPEHDPLTKLDLWIDFIFAKQETNSSEDNPVCGCPFFTSGAQCDAEEEQVRLTSLEMAEKATRYNAALVRELQDAGYLDAPGDPQQLGRLLLHYVQGLLLYGRVKKDLDAVTIDLRTGIYRLIGLKPALRHEKTPD